MSSLLYINGDEVPEYGMRYTQSWIDFEETARTIDRTLVSDFVAFKRKFFITWEQPVSSAFLAEILTLYLAKDDVTFTDNLTAYTCRLNIDGDVLRDILVSAGVAAFSGLAIVLEEV